MRHADCKKCKIALFYLFLKYLNFIICEVVARHVCWLVLCSAKLVDLASYKVRLLVYVANYKHYTYRAECGFYIAWLKMLEDSA